MTTRDELSRRGHSRTPSARAFTIVEMLVAISIFIALGGALVAMSHQAMGAWRTGETRRLVYERAEAVFSQITLDLHATYTREPKTAKTVPMARFICTGGGDKAQRLSFVRTFETGPERSITYYVGSKKDAKGVYTDGFAGDPSSLRPLGGLLGVTYSLDGRALRRATLGPPAPPTKSLRVTTGRAPGEILTDNVLHFSFRFWTQHTRSWKGTPPFPRGRGKGGGIRRSTGPEIVWDSTRGAGVVAVDAKTGRSRAFSLSRGGASLDYPMDDVFPEIVEITLVVEPDEARAPRTELVEGLSAAGTVAYVGSTAKLPDPEESSPYLMIGGEWVKCSGTLDGAYRIDRRGVRGTAAVSHDAGTEVRAGTTFVSRVHVPAYREDWTSETEFRRKVRRR